MGWITYVLKPLAAHNKMSSVSTGGSVIATPRRKKYVGVDRWRGGGEGVGALDILQPNPSFFNTLLPAAQTPGDNRHDDACRTSLRQNFRGFVRRCPRGHNVVGQ